MNYAQETNGRGIVTCQERFTFITANLLQGLNIVGKIQNMTSALNRLAKVRIAMSSFEEATPLSNMVRAQVEAYYYLGLMSRITKVYVCFQTKLESSDASPHHAVITGQRKTYL